MSKSRGKLLLFGAKGMLGYALQQVFADYRVITQDLPEVNIVDEEEVHEAVRKVDPDLIVNAAAYTDVDGAETEREKAFAANERGVANIARAAREHGVAMVHYSTDYVFPSLAQAPAGGFPEDYPPGPAVNVYGESKLAGEVALKASGALYYLLRTAWLYGPRAAPLGGPRSRLAAGAKVRKKNFVEAMLQLAGQQKVIRVVDDQCGSPTLTQDVARATREIIEGSYTPGIYHVVNSGQASWCDFAREIFRQKGLEVKVEPIKSAEYPLPAKRPRYSILRNTRGPALRAWQEALKDYLNNLDGTRERV